MTNPTPTRRSNDDPTYNVLALVESNSKRQDDLRAAQAERFTSEMALRAEFQRETRMQESERINAIRAVDVQAAARDAIVSQAAANTLASQVAASAEAMRAQVQATAQQAQVSQANELEPIRKAIEDLRRSQYDLAGKASGAAEVKDEGRQGAQSARAGNQWVMGFVVSVVGLLLLGGSLTISAIGVLVAYLLTR